MTGLHLRFPHDLEKILLICANQAGEGVLTFLKNGFFKRKTEMNVWLESKVLTGKSASELAKLYPGGSRMFYRNFRIYQSMTPRQWLRRRRLELGAVWLRHGGSSIDAIAKALGYPDLKRFRSDYITEHRYAPEREERLRDAPSLSDAILGVCLRPFWNFDVLTMREDAIAQVYQHVPPSNGQRRRRRRKQSAQNSSISPKKMIPSCAYAALPGWAASEPCDDFAYPSVAPDDSDEQSTPDEPAPPARTTDKRRWEPQKAPFRYYEKALSGRPNYRSNAPGEQPKIARNDPALGKFWSLETTGVGDIIPFPPPFEPVPSAPSTTRSRMVKAA
jgi:AraC-like DNA-binding protein